MKKLFLLVLVTLVCPTIKAQETPIIGEKFELNPETELNPTIVLRDNYNFYLHTVTNTFGMLAKHEITFRKFDQKNQLVNTYTKDFKIDISTLHNHLGSFELDNNKVAVYIESYANKSKKTELYQYVFDKTTGEFSTKVVASYPLANLLQMGTFRVNRSQNGSFIGVVFEKYHSRKEAEEIDCMVLDSQSLNEVFKKTITYTDASEAHGFTVTNTGKIILVRYPNSNKEKKYLTCVDGANQINKTVEEALGFDNPKMISIGSMEYLVAFNYADKRYPRGNYTHIVFYDFENGRVLKNTPIDFKSSTEMTAIAIDKVFIENNEIHLFVEGQFKNGIIPSKSFPNNPNMGDPKYAFGPCRLLIFNTEGDYKSTVNFDNRYYGDYPFYHSMGVVKIMNDYLVQTGGFSEYSTIYKVAQDTKSIANYSPNYNITNNVYCRNVNQLFWYNNDTRMLTIARSDKPNSFYFASMPYTK
ncbi:hypothetical protein [Flavobacterium sp.]|uniref:hypothetical protein n=1 Tax=Flavobacterium sp. TaxID=239 RepID=UPI0026114CF6|nr:hypothetical protein [Flavobacterium sp.]